VKFANAQAFQLLCDSSYKKCSETIIKENFKYWEEIYSVQIDGKKKQNTDYCTLSVDIFDLTGEYICTCRSLREAAKYLKVSAQAVCQAIKHNNTCACKIVVLSGDEESKNKIMAKLSIDDNDKIYQYSLDGVLLNTYACINNIINYDKRQIRQCIYGNILTTQGFIWIKNSETIEERINAIQSHKIYSNNVSVYAFNQNGELEFSSNSVPEMAIKLNTSSNRIRACCDNKIKTINGYILQYSDSVDKDRLQSIRNSKFINIKSIPIAQYDLNGNYIQSFESVNIARQKLKIYHINECLSGKRKTAGGYM